MIGELSEFLCNASNIRAVQFCMCIPSRAFLRGAIYLQKYPFGTVLGYIRLFLVVACQDPQSHFQNIGSLHSRSCSFSSLLKRRFEGPTDVLQSNFESSLARASDSYLCRAQYKVSADNIKQSKQNIYPKCTSSVSDYTLPYALFLLEILLPLHKCLLVKRAISIAARSTRAKPSV